MATSVRCDLCSYAPLGSVRRIAVGRRFSRESAFYPFLSKTMYGHTITQFIGFRRSLLYQVLVPRRREAVARQSDVLRWKRFRRILRVTYGSAYIIGKRSYPKLCHIGYFGLGAVGRGCALIFMVYVNLIRFALLGLPSEKVGFYFDTRCKHWHRKEG